MVTSQKVLVKDLDSRFRGNPEKMISQEVPELFGKLQKM